jgi:hypothetical protein
MDKAILTIVSTFTEIAAAAEALPTEEKAKLLKAIAEMLERAPAKAAGTARRAGLHEGAWEVAPDFDAPLPDDFWTGV